MKTPAISTLTAATAMLLSLAAPIRADILYVSDFGGHNIEKFTSGGSRSVFTSNSTFSPWGLAFDSTGNLYAADYFNNTILKFTPGGVRSVFADASKGLVYPRSLAFDSVGNLYVATANDATISKFTPGGVGSVFASSGLSSPFDLAFTNDAGVPLPLANQVPEPSAALLLLSAAALCARRRKRA